MLFSQQFRLQESVLRKHVENTSHTDLRRGVIYEMQEPKRPDPSDVEKDGTRVCSRLPRRLCAPGHAGEDLSKVGKDFHSLSSLFFSYVILCKTKNCTALF